MWIAAFRLVGTPLEHVALERKCDVSFADAGDATTVPMLATYSVMEDRDTVVSRGTEAGWAENFVKLDALLARG